MNGPSRIAPSGADPHPGKGVDAGSSRIVEQPMAHMDGTWMNQMMWAMWIPSVIILGALVALGIWAVRRFSPGSGSDARRILEERFARGEIDADEFRSRLASLERR
jgi:putative membrane protein